MRSDILIDPDPSQCEWEAFLSGFGLGNLQQCYEYGEVAKIINPHTRVVRLLAFNEDTPVGLAQAKYNTRFGFGDRVEVGGVYGYGPVIGDSVDNNRIVSELITSLERSTVKDRVCESFIFTLKRTDVLERLGYALKKTFNVYKVGLQKGVEELWKRIAHNKRRNIKKAESHGVNVICSTKYEDLNAFYEMHALSGKRAGFIPHSHGYFASFHKVFSASGRARVFLSVFGNRPVAGVFVVVHGDTAYALGAGSREEVWYVRPNDILHWKAMEWACNEGLSYYHMGFVSEPPPSKSSMGWGLWRWKREWNGVLENVHVYHKVLMPKFKKFFLNPYEKIYNIAGKLRFYLS
jgi:hypothetical protein